MQPGEGDDCMSLLRNKQEDEWYEESKQGDENGGKERLQEFLLPRVIVEVVGLDRQKLKTG